MDLVVLVKRVPDTGEADLVVAPGGRSIGPADLPWGTNEWDDYAVEAAVRLKEAHGGRVTALTLGGPEAEDVLRRALAMGCDAALHLVDAVFEGLDPFGVAAVLAAALKTLPFDLLLAGAVASDDGHGQTGGLLAGLLGLPSVALATHLAVEGHVARVRHEVEGGLEREVEVDLPAVVTVQTGIVEPRYVSIRGIRKVAGVTIPRAGAADLGLAPAALHPLAGRLVVQRLSAPPAGQGAEILGGGVDAAVDALVRRWKERGGILG